VFQLLVVEMFESNCEQSSIASEKPVMEQSAVLVMLLWSIQAMHDKSFMQNYCQW